MAINSVVAGCEPEYIPVIVAVLEAIGDPRWDLPWAAMSTGGAAVFMLVRPYCSGIRDRL